jgi:Uma2 family endonuclease
MAKMREYFENGAKLAWLVLPEERSVLVFAPDGRVSACLAGETLDGGDLLPELRIPIDELFS